MGGADTARRVYAVQPSAPQARIQGVQPVTPVDRSRHDGVWRTTVATLDFLLPHPYALRGHGPQPYGIPHRGHPLQHVASVTAQQPVYLQAPTAARPHRPVADPADSNAR